MNTPGIISAIISGLIAFIIPLLIERSSGERSTVTTAKVVTAFTIVSVCAILPTLYALYNWTTIGIAAIVVTFLVTGCRLSYDYRDYIILVFQLSCIGIIIGVLIRIAIIVFDISLY